MKVLEFPFGDIERMFSLTVPTVKECKDTVFVLPSAWAAEQARGAFLSYVRSRTWGVHVPPSFEVLPGFFKTLVGASVPSYLMKEYLVEEFPRHVCKYYELLGFLATVWLKEVELPESFGGETVEMRIKAVLEGREEFPGGVPKRVVMVNGFFPNLLTVRLLQHLERKFGTEVVWAYGFRLPAGCEEVDRRFLKITGLSEEMRGERVALESVSLVKALTVEKEVERTAKYLKSLEGEGYVFLPPVEGYAERVRRIFESEGLKVLGSTAPFSSTKLGSFFNMLLSFWRTGAFVYLLPLLRSPAVSPEYELSEDEAGKFFEALSEFGEVRRRKWRRALELLGEEELGEKVEKFVSKVDEVLESKGREFERGLLSLINSARLTEEEAEGLGKLLEENRVVFGEEVEGWKMLSSMVERGKGAKQEVMTGEGRISLLSLSAFPLVAADWSHVMGVVDGWVPTPKFPKWLLDRIDPSLEEGYLNFELVKFFYALGCGERVSLSYPQLDDEMRDLFPSPVLDDLPLEEWVEDELPRRTAIRSKTLEFKPYTREKVAMTAVEDYYVCPLLFYFRHLEKVEPAYISPEGPSAKLKGTLLHNLVEKLVREVEDWSDEDEVRGIGRSIAFEDEIFEKLSLSLTDYEIELLARDTADLAMRMARVERVYRDLFEATPLLLEEWVSAECEGVELVGRMDRVDVVRGGKMIIDYKTGARSRTPEVGKNGFGSLQLFLYANAYDPPAVVGLAIYPLKQFSEAHKMVPQVLMLSEEGREEFWERYVMLASSGAYTEEEMKILYRLRDNSVSRFSKVREAFSWLSEYEKRGLPISVRWASESRSELMRRAWRTAVEVVKRLKEGDYTTFFAPSPEDRMICGGKFHKGYHFCAYGEVCRNYGDYVRKALEGKTLQL